MHLVTEFMLKTLEAFGVLVDGSHVFLEDDSLCGGGTDNLRQPSEVSRAPSGTARVADIV
jgi:hypothetical protein